MTSMALEEISELASKILSVQRVQAKMKSVGSVSGGVRGQVSDDRFQIVPTKRRFDRVSRHCSGVSR